MKEKINIDQPHLKENPYTVPEGYFDDIKNTIGDRISARRTKIGTWSVIKPQLALVSTFAIVFIIGYSALQLFTPSAPKTSSQTAASYSKPVESNYLDNSFIDFYDDKADSLSQIKEIDPDQIVEYLDTDANIVYLACLE